MIQIDVEGRPAPKGSRIMRHTKAGKGYTYAASKYEKPWVDAVRDAAQIVMRHHPMPEPPYAVELEFRIHKARQTRFNYPCGSDLDKLVRAVFDGLVNGGALKDDSHVTVLTASKRYVVTGETTGVCANIRSLAATEQQIAA